MQTYQTLEIKYFIKSDYGKFTGEILNAKIKEKGLVDKSCTSRFIDNSDLDKKIADSNTCNKSRIKSRSRQSKETSSV